MRTKIDSYHTCEQFTCNLEAAETGDGKLKNLGSA